MDRTHYKEDIQLMEVDSSGRCKDIKGTEDPSRQVLCQGTGMATLSGGAEETPWQWHQGIHGREIGADRRHLQEQPRTDGTMALDTVQTNQ